MPNKLRDSKKDLINTKSNDNKYILWCHIRHLISERVKKADIRMINGLDYVDIKFLVSKKDYCKIEQKNNTCINVFCYENDLVYHVHVSDKNVWIYY